MLHLLKDHKGERGKRMVTVKCGAAIPDQKNEDPVQGWTAWASEVTCPDCTHKPKEVDFV